MTTAFQLGAFQFGAFQIDPVWDGTTVLTRAPYGINWSRKRFREWLEAKRAQEDVEAKAKESTGKRREALAAAAKQAETALLAVEEATAATQLVALTNALEAAKSAKYVADVVRAANEARAIAEEMQDEEEAIAFLLLNG